MSKLIYAYDDLENKVVLSYENISPTNLSDRSVFKDNNEGLKSVAVVIKTIAIDLYHLMLKHEFLHTTNGHLR